MVRHEVRSCCYCLKDSRLNPILSNQAAEAMGAISHPSSLPILKEYLADSNRSVRETCEIAVSKIEWDNSEEGKKHHASLNESAVPYVIPYLHLSPLLIFPVFIHLWIQLQHLLVFSLGPQIQGPSLQLE